MNVLILAAGYATRLYPLTLNKAKPLLEVAGKPMIEWVLDNLAPIPDIDTVYIVTNNKFAADFQAWADDYVQAPAEAHFKIVNDGSTSDTDKLGAIGDIHLVVKPRKPRRQRPHRRRGRQPVQRVARRLRRDSRKSTPPPSPPTTWATWRRSRNTTTSTIDDDGRDHRISRKSPPTPTSTITGIALYYYSADVVPMFDQYIAEGNNPDQPGRFVQWLYQRMPVHTYLVGGTWFDIGSKETLEEAERDFRQVRQITGAQTRP